MRSKNVSVQIDLGHVRGAAERLRKRLEKPLIAVVKNDAYGLGAPEVTNVLSDLVDDFAFFSIEEAQTAKRSGLILGPPSLDREAYLRLNCRPVVTSETSAKTLRGLGGAVFINSNMNGLGAPPQEAHKLVSISGATEVMTHTESIEGVQTLLRSLPEGFRGTAHAAGTALLHRKDAVLDAVRPGLALYQGAMKVWTRLHAVKEVADGTVGYKRQHVERVGIVLAGYGAGLRPGPIVINGRIQRILECGMNTSFVSVSQLDKPEDEVVLLGDQITETMIAQEFGIREQEVLSLYSSLGYRSYI